MQPHVVMSHPTMEFVKNFPDIIRLFGLHLRMDNAGRICEGVLNNSGKLDHLAVGMSKSHYFQFEIMFNICVSQNLPFALPCTCENHHIDFMYLYHIGITVCNQR